MSRRSFIRNVGLAGSVALGATALAGCAASPAAQQSGAATGDAAGRWSWSVPPEPIADADIAETLDCELCIVGAGVAGNPAALYAAAHGYDAIVLQKESSPQVNGQGCGSWNTKYGVENGLEWNISRDIQDFASISNGKPNLRLVRNVMERSGAAIEWIVSEVPDPAPTWAIVEDTHTGCQWILDDDYSTRYAGFKQLHDNIAAKAAEYGARYLYSTPAVQLVTDDNGGVVGVIGQADDGSYVRVNASKGVILCTGDISDDEEMLEAYCPVMLGVPTNHAVPSNTGDGLKMGLWVGADMDDPPSGVQMFITPSALPQGTAPCAGLPYLHVNMEGKRFFNENGGDQYQGTSIALQPDHRAYQIMDSHVVEQGGCTQKELEEGLELGNTYQADTIEGLAEAVGIPSDELVRTVERYNELVEGGDDLDFGVDPEVFTNSIKDAPFYLMEYQASKFVAAPGLACNEYLQVLSKDRQVIDGLYAAGNVQGSFFGYDYPVNGFGGFSLGRSMAGGVLAVMSAMDIFDEEIG